MQRIGCLLAQAYGQIRKWSRSPMETHPNASCDVVSLPMSQPIALLYDRVDDTLGPYRNLP